MRLRKTTKYFLVNPKIMIRILKTKTIELKNQNFGLLKNNLKLGGQNYEKTKQKKNI